MLMETGMELVTKSRKDPEGQEISESITWGQRAVGVQGQAGGGGKINLPDREVRARSLLWHCLGNHASSLNVHQQRLFQ